MKQVRLKSLSIQNFKGMDRFSFETNGKSVEVFGDNASGKTTIYDAYLWLLFGRDSQNRADFSIRPVGKEKDQIETKVSAIFDIDGQEVYITKGMSSKLTKKRGTSEREFQGFTYRYEIDSLPVSEAEYKNRISMLFCDETTFRILSDIYYFPKAMHWKDRRKILMSLVDMSGFSVPQEIQELLGKHTERELEDIKKSLANSLNKINKELEELPARISELSNIITDTISESEEDIISLDRQEKTLMEDMEKLNDKIDKIQELENIEINKLIEQKQSLENKIRQNNTYWDNIEEDIKIKIEQTKGRINLIEQNLKILSSDRERLLIAYKEVANAQYNNNNICPACGQQLPQNIIEQVIKKWEAVKQEKLDKIKQKGLTCKSQIDEETAKLNELQNRLSDLLKEKDEIKYKRPIQDEENKEIAKLDSKIRELKANKYTSSSSSSIEALKARKKEIGDKILNIRKKKTEIEATKNISNRIEELRIREQELSLQYREQENKIFMIEKYIKDKMEYISRVIANKFKNIEFLLFRKQINGGIEEICEIAHNGVPYQDVNHGMKILIGLEIVKALSEYYKLSIPIFIDNFEAITKNVKELPAVGQVIALCVAPNTNIKIKEV